MNSFRSPILSAVATTPVMKRNSSLLLGALCTALLLLSASHAAAQANAKPPTQLTYQGFLTDGNGVPFGNTAPVNKTVIFRIYDALTGGAIKWSAQQVVTVDKGYFSVLLGQGSAVGTEPFTADLTGVFTGSSTVSDRYLELTADGTTIAPRLRFLPAPYALLARSATELLDPLTGTSSLSISSGNVNVGGSLNVSSVTASGNLSVSGITASGNITANGNLSAANLSGNGANLTSLNASQFSTGTLPDARLSGTYSSPLTMNNAGNTFGGNGTVPLGGIIMWSGATTAIPAGWKLCDGNNGTPNLKDRFIVGAGGAYAMGATGGSTTTTLTSANLPTFDITYLDIFFSESGSLNPGISTTALPYNFGTKGGADYDNVGYQMSRTATRTGSSSPVNILPPYYALAFIMRVQ